MFTAAPLLRRIGSKVGPPTVNSRAVVPGTPSSGWPATRWNPAANAQLELDQEHIGDTTTSSATTRSATTTTTTASAGTTAAELQVRDHRELGDRPAPPLPPPRIAAAGGRRPLYAVSMTFEKRVETYFHLTSWAPGAIRLEDVYLTPIEASRYWTAQHDAQLQYEARLPEMMGFRDALVRLGLSPEAAARAKGQAQAAKEDVYERVRAGEFSDAPSRRRCMFVCESEAQLREYMDRYKFPTAGRTVFELQMVTWTVEPTETQLSDMQLSREGFERLNELRRIRVNPRFLDSNGVDNAERTTLARRYWSSDNTEPEQLTEVLFEGFFVVKRIVETWPVVVPEHSTGSAPPSGPLA